MAEAAKRPLVDYQEEEEAEGGSEDEYIVPRKRTRMQAAGAGKLNKPRVIPLYKAHRGALRCVHLYREPPEPHLPVSGHHQQVHPGFRL